MMCPFIRRSILLATLALAGCATGWFNDSAKREFLQPWIELTGAQMSMSAGAHRTDYIVFQRPAALSVRGNALYLADAGLRRIFRYDRTQQMLTPFATNLPVETGMSIYAAPDESVYITLPSTGKVLHFSWGGIPLPSLAAPGIVARPISVAVDERTGNVLVADDLYNHIVVFSNLGGMLAVIKPPQVQSVSAIATGPDGIYVIDRLAKRVVVLGPEGGFRYAFAADSASEPGSIAVNRDNLVFLGDNFDNTIRVFKAQVTKETLLVGKIGGVGASDNFNGIAGLAVEDDMLYVADSLNARIQAFLINPDAMGSGR